MLICWFFARDDVTWRDMMNANNTWILHFNCILIYSSNRIVLQFESESIPPAFQMDGETETPGYTYEYAGSQREGEVK